MNAKQKLHMSKLAQLTALFQEQASSGLTVKSCCRQHNTYNYWKQRLKINGRKSALLKILHRYEKLRYDGQRLYRIFDNYVFFLMWKINFSAEGVPA